MNERWVCVRDCFCGPVKAMEYYRIGDRLEPGIEPPGKYFALIDLDTLKVIKLSGKLQNSDQEVEKGRVIDQLRTMGLPLEKQATSLLSAYKTLLKKLGKLQ